MPSILAPSAKWAERSRRTKGQVWVLFLETSHGVRIFSDGDIPDGIVPTALDLYDGTRTYDGSQRYGFARASLLGRFPGAVLRWPGEVRDELTSESTELIAAGNQWRVSPWSVLVSPVGNWWRDALRRREKVLMQAGWLVQTWDDLAPDEGVERARGVLKRYRLTETQLLLEYEPL